MDLNLDWGAVGLNDVSEDVLRQVFSGVGVDLDACVHVTANESLAKAMRMSGLRAISAVELTDVLVWDSMPGTRRIPIGSYPTFERSDEPPTKRVDPIAAPLAKWRSDISGKRIGSRLHTDNVLRTHLRNDAVHEDEAAHLRRSVRDFRASLEFLTAANFRPDDFEAGDPLMRVALDAWRHLESTESTFANVRRDLWDHVDEVADPRDTRSKDLRRRLDAIVRHVFASAGERVQVLLHGFFFFTPPQWALFQLLKAHPSVGLCFVVHDDGRDRAFETWRHYFLERWMMPAVRYLPVPASAVRSDALASSLEGRRVDARALSANTRIVRFANATEFVREWRLRNTRINEEELKPILFAPGPDDLERIVDRLSSESSGMSVNLANIPVGQFLLAAHECVEYVGRSTVERTLEGGRLVDMAASGFLDSQADGMHPSRHVPAIRRAVPFFEGLRRMDQWLERAVALERLVVAEVAQLGAKNQGHSDVERMATAVGNELRQVPWCDLTGDEVRAVRFAVEAASAVADEIASEDLRRSDNYLAWIRKRLERAMADLDPEGRDEVEQRLRGVSTGLDGVLDPEGIRDVVSLILGREIDTGPSDDDARTGKRVKDVRSLDALGFRKSTVDVHVANLAETLFPRKVSPYNWPFSAGVLRHSDRRNVSVEILATRAVTAPLGDLYLFRLALDGVGPASELTLSWIGESGNDRHNPSTLLSLVSEPAVRSAVVKELVGGLSPSPADQGVPDGGSRELPAVRPFDPVGAETATANAVTNIPAAAKGSASICARRFVLQWALGPSGSFQSPHQHSMLYGNVLGALSRRGRFARSGADAPAVRARLVDDLWRYLTPGQRASSKKSCRVRVDGVTAHWTFIFTIGGFKNGNSPTDRAYQVAQGRLQVDPQTVVGGSLLNVLPEPDPEVTGKTCNMCPVAPRCAVRRRDD